LVYLSG